ncbi:MAG: carboxymuconolactone decarboxylase family protein [Proteobacteria bacterium]|uniref:carboxymuconolactone decarboxylase family protein n=1 Tax=Rudaea sp. TaxID=2136325 RepID=UPI001D98FBB2|nr:carboxymuconolactone decarboxylase family protein [Pseudomonadota bacterium]MBS0568527.1 carboxymuconolactone decarboxylase family protein [Pseudomonadota bacterium]
MQPRLNHRIAAPAAFRGLDETRRYLDACGLDRKLRLLLEIRVSQINGCAYCVDKHVSEARAAGEAQQRLDCLCVWRETSLFDARERAALAWAEALTLLAQSHAPDDVYGEVRAQFDDKALADLTLAIALINAFNRFGVGFRLAPAQHA